jgi:pimeloyl-ACP methyl ester carboxylesterase
MKMTGTPSTGRRSSGRLLGLAATAALTVAATIGVTTHSRSADAGAPPATDTSTIAWGDCSDGAESWQCASLTVPIDYARPDGPTIDLALTRLPASDQARRIGPLVLNFGGPGGPAVVTSHQLAPLMFSDEMRARFDLVGFDPRGVGESAPLDCKLDLEAYYAVDITPDTPAEREAQVKAGRAFSDACAANGGPLLPFMGTDSVVQDMERLRIALGEDKLSFWGPSYGTSIAVQYVEQFPSHVRAFSIEDVLATEIKGLQWLKEVTVGYEQSFNAFLAGCAADTACPFHSGGNPGAAFDAMMARLDNNPLAVPGDPRPVGQSEVLEVIDGGLWRLANWPELATALAMIDAGDATGVRKWADGARGRGPDGAWEAPNGMYVHLAVTCVDNQFPHDVAAYQAFVDEVMKLTPRAGAYYLNKGFACVDWPAPGRATRPAPTGHGLPLLVVGGTNDNQTPYIWAERLAGQLDNSVLLTREGAGHTSYLLSTCVAEHVDAYLLNLTLPAPGTVCPSVGGIFNLHN